MLIPFYSTLSTCHHQQVVHQPVVGLTCHRERGGCPVLAGRVVDRADVPAAVLHAHELHYQRALQLREAVPGGEEVEAALLLLVPPAQIGVSRFKQHNL